MMTKSTADSNILMLTTVCATCFSTLTASANLLTNPGFETSDLTGWTIVDGTVGVGGHGDSFPDSFVLGYSESNKAKLGVWASEGNYAAFGGGGRIEPSIDALSPSRTVFKQTVSNYLPGARYEIGFSVAAGINAFGAFGPAIFPRGSASITFIGIFEQMKANLQPYSPFDFNEDGEPPIFSVPTNLINQPSASPITFKTPKFRINPGITGPQDVVFDFASYGSGPYSFDNFFYTQVTSGAGEVVNGQFSTGTLDGFSQSTDGAGVAVAVEVGDGDFAAQLTTGSEIVLFQSLNTPETNFDISFDYEFLQAAGTLEVSIGEVVIGTLDAPETLPGELTEEIITVSSNSLKDLTDTTLNFTFFDEEADQSIVIDNIEISFVSVPEPSSAVVLALTCLALLRRRRVAERL